MSKASHFIYCLVREEENHVKDGIVKVGDMIGTCVKILWRFAEEGTNTFPMSV